MITLEPPVSSRYNLNSKPDLLFIIDTNKEFLAVKEANKSDIPIVAIGGINSKNYKKLLLNKVNFLAISGYIWRNKLYKPLKAIERFK